MKKYLLIIILHTFCTLLHAQNTNQVVNSGGEHFNNGNVSISYSIGEPVITTLTTENNVLTQGFLQPATDRNITVEVLIDFYPNPVTNDLYLINAGEVSYYKIYNTEGKFIKQGLLQVNTSIPMSTMSGGMYFVEIFDQSDRILATLRIIKI